MGRLNEEKHHQRDLKEIKTTKLFNSCAIPNTGKHKKIRE
jgi:hypothetical protein